MYFKPLKHLTIGNKRVNMGTLIRIKPIDTILDDRSLVYHYSEDRYCILNGDDYSLVYESLIELQNKKEDDRSN